MHKLNHIEHSHLAGRLIEAVGGLAPASRITGLGQTSLSNYQNPSAPATMPARVISELQIAARVTLYSDALSDEVEQPEAVQADPMLHACGLVKEAADVLGAVQTSLDDGIVSAADFAGCDRALADLEERIAILRAGLRGKLVRVV